MNTTIYVFISSQVELGKQWHFHHIIWERKIIFAIKQIKRFMQ